MALTRNWIMSSIEYRTRRTRSHLQYLPCLFAFPFAFPGSTNAGVIRANEQIDTFIVFFAFNHCYRADALFSPLFFLSVLEIMASSFIFSRCVFCLNNKTKNHNIICAKRLLFVSHLCRQLDPLLLFSRRLSLIIRRLQFSSHVINKRNN